MAWGGVAINPGLSIVSLDYRPNPHSFVDIIKFAYDISVITDVSYNPLALRMSAIILSANSRNRSLLSARLASFHCEIT